MNSLGKIFRGLLYLLCISLALRLSYGVYTTLFELLSFQIEIYAYMLQGKEMMNGVSESAQGVIQDVAGFFGKEINNEVKESLPIESRLQAFESLLKKVSGFSGIVIGMISYFITTKILFGARKHYDALLTFIR